MFRLRSPFYGPNVNRLSRLQKGLLVLGLVAIGFYGVFRWAFPVETVRYRLTLTVTDGTKSVTGSSVVETIWRYQRPGPIRALADGATWAFEMKGEAVVLDLGSRGMMFAVLMGADSNDGEPSVLVPHALGFRGMAEMTPELLKRRKRTAERIDLPRDKLPLLVRFRDLADPKSVERVNPNDLAASFGPDVRLTVATIEITDKPITTEVGRHLPWLPSYYNSRLDGQRFGMGKAPNKLANSLSSGDFRAY